MSMVFCLPGEAGLAGREDTGWHTSVVCTGRLFLEQRDMGLGVLCRNSRLPAPRRRRQSLSQRRRCWREVLWHSRHVLSVCLLPLSVSLVFPLLSRGISHHLACISTTSQWSFTAGCNSQGGWQIFDALFLLALATALGIGSSSHILPEQSLRLTFP